MYSHLDAYSLLTDALHQYIEGQMDENQCATEWASFPKVSCRK